MGIVSNFFGLNLRDSEKKLKKIEDQIRYRKKFSPENVLNGSYDTKAGNLEDLEKKLSDTKKKYKKERSSTNKARALVATPIIAAGYIKHSYDKSNKRLVDSRY
jgi:hypothetical protein